MAHQTRSHNPFLSGTVFGHVYERDASLRTLIYELIDEQRGALGQGSAWYQAEVSNFLVVSSKCESQIEERLLAAILYCARPYCVKPVVADHQFGEQRNPADFNVYIQPQVGPYFPDLLLATGSRLIDVEADGAQFHKTTEDQIRHDKARDDFFARRQITVFRFDGSIIRADARRCAGKVLHFAVWGHCE